MNIFFLFHSARKKKRNFCNLDDDGVVGSVRRQLLARRFPAENTIPGKAVVEAELDLSSPAGKNPFVENEPGFEDGRDERRVLVEAGPVLDGDVGVDVELL